MPDFEILLLLLVAVVLVATLARQLNVPYPILLVLGGLVLALIPQVPDVHLDPDLVLVIFLPPLIFSAAWQTPVRDLRRNLRPVLLLSVGLVVFTAFVVGIVLEALVPGLPFAAALAFGAIVGPTDAIAATSVLRKLAVPRRLILILESESLLNDATALTLYRTALAAVATGGIVVGDLFVGFVVSAVGGVLFGLGLAIVSAWVWKRLSDPPVEVTLSLLLPYAAYLPADRVGVSGVIATVTAALYLGFRSSRLQGSDTRVLASGTWQMVVFVLNGLAFILVGLQLPVAASALAGRSLGQLVVMAVIISATVVVARFAWVFPAMYLPLRLAAGARGDEKTPGIAGPTVVSWAGLRGVVSLALALALPLDFPERDLMLLLTFVVILVTLVGQGLTLPLLLRRLGMSAGTEEIREEAEARGLILDAALARLDGLREEWPDHLPLIANIDERLSHRTEHLATDGDPSPGREQELSEHRAILHAVIDAEREALVDGRDRGEIGDEVLRRIERELDLEELRLQTEL
jgi:monovalent cation/hydrogen antiporter